VAVLHRHHRREGETNTREHAVRRAEGIAYVSAGIGLRSREGYAGTS